ncbi:MAG: hypothetical protein ACUVWY_06565 [Desulfosoma sp.]|uniref:hypothetical protein n=1 Tax=Desulfosoma sp. TaxID=2603217 RepID=UPI00404B0BB3
MSFYCYLTTTQAIVMAADNKKEVLNLSSGLHGTFRSEKVTAWNARKIHAVGSGWWMTGVGLSAFLDGIRAQVRNLLEDRAKEASAAVDVMERLTAASQWVQSLHEQTVAGLMQAMPPGLEKAEWLEHQQEIVFAGFDGAMRPVVIRAQSAQGFAFERRTGAALLGFAGDNGGWNAAVIEAVDGILSNILDDLMRQPMEQAVHRAWDLIPPLFQRMARAFPEKLSASGDLLFLTPAEHRWFLF